MRSRRPGTVSSIARRFWLLAALRAGRQACCLGSSASPELRLAGAGAGSGVAAACRLGRPERRLRGRLDPDTEEPPLPLHRLEDQIEIYSLWLTRKEAGHPHLTRSGSFRASGTASAGTGGSATDRTAAPQLSEDLGKPRGAVGLLEPRRRQLAEHSVVPRRVGLVERDQRRPDQHEQHVVGRHREPLRWWLRLPLRLAPAAAGLCLLRHPLSWLGLLLLHGLCGGGLAAAAQGAASARSIRKYASNDVDTNATMTGMARRTNRQKVSRGRSRAE